MYDRQFFSTRLGRASLASVMAMVVFAVLSTQVGMIAPQHSIAQINQVIVA